MRKACAEAPRLTERLTEKELSCLRFLAGGIDNNELPQWLSLTPLQVSILLEGIRGKFKADTDTQAAVAASRCGLI